jgi:two-component system, LuxR family, response regulator FixJ
MPGRPPIVLIANNDEGLRDALLFVLQLEGVEVHVHKDGASVLADPDLSLAGCLIITDRMLPMDGFEVLKLLAARQMKLPSILLTSDATLALRSRARAAGIWLTLEKPILDNALVEGVLSILSHNSCIPT